MTWTDERVELLKKLWSEGLSASRIATELGEVSRNAVIGKVHRLGLSGRVRHPVGTARTRRVKSSTPNGSPTIRRRTNASTPEVVSAVSGRDPRSSPHCLENKGNTALAFAKNEGDTEPQMLSVKKPDIDPQVEYVEKVSIMSLTERTCRWPLGDPQHDDFGYCGHESMPGVPYCDHHRHIAYHNVSERRREREKESVSSET